jgi:putative nucleotidyltransferase with HDIG domain
MTSLSFPPELREFALVFRNAGKSCYIVGGAVRDSLIGKSVCDYDAATDARPEEVMRLFKRVVPTGIKHGTVTVIWKGKPIETTTFRRESGYADGRHPDEVEYGASLEEDLSRRDFTINALAYEPLEKSLVDLYGGQKDLERRLIRAVGNAAERFEEDGLRPLRALRFASQLGFEIEPETLAAIRPSLERFRLVSPERVREELEKILRSPKPSTALRLMEETGMLAIVLPELVRCRGVEQKGLHRFDVLDHLYASVDAAPADPFVRLAALLHDIGKPETRALGADGIATFYGHEALSAREATQIMRRLRFPNAVIDEVAHLVRQHMFFYEDSWTDAAVRRFLARVGETEVERLFALRLADGTGMTGIPAPPESLDPLRRRIERILSDREAFKLKDLAIGGNELSSLGIPKGPAMGKILAELLETVLDDPGQNTREKLLEIAGKIRDKYGVN